MYKTRPFFVSSTVPPTSSFTVLPSTIDSHPYRAFLAIQIQTRSIIMKTFAAAVTFALAATGLAAPTIEKRATGTITFFTGTSYGGSSASLSFDSNTQQGYKCGESRPHMH
jgi:hypothetical protein